jgi:hypothetical protein
MHNLENDMDDLFRKAASGYPVRPSPNCWPEISARIESIVDSPKSFFGLFQYSKNAILKYFTVLIFTTPVISLFIMINEISKHTTGVSLNNSNILNRKTFSPSNVNFSTQYLTRKSNATGPSFNKKKSQIPNELNAKIPELDDTETVLNKKIDIGIYAIRNREANLNISNHPLFQHLVIQPQAIHHNVKIQDSVLQKIAEWQIIKHTHIKKFYVGVGLGPILSKVGNELPKHVGYDAGILFGLKLTKKLSAETGIGYSRQYCTMGKDDLTKSLSWPLNSLALVHANCERSVVEVPIQLNYYILHKSRQKVFCSAGLSSYIDLQYNYDIIWEVSNSPFQTTRSYNNRQLLASTVNFGLGYENNINNLGIIRIEPFIQIPAHELSGDPPIYNIGVHIAMNWMIF